MSLQVRDRVFRLQTEVRGKVREFVAFSTVDSQFVTFITVALRCARPRAVLFVFVLADRGSGEGPGRQQLVSRAVRLVGNGWNQTQSQRMFV